MQIFKKVLVSIIIFIFTFVLISAPIIYNFINSEYEYYQDSKERNRLSGTLDFLIIGSCQGMQAFVPNVIDEALNCNSYNLCSNHLSPNGEIEFLSKEIKRNPIKYVIIDIDYDLLSFSSKGSKAQGEMITITRLDNFKERFDCFVNDVYIEDYPIVYSTFMSKGIEYIVKKAFDENNVTADFSEKGYNKGKIRDFSMSEYEVLNLRNSENLCTDIVENNDKKLENLIDICKKNNIGVIMITAPSSDNFIWTHTGWDKIYNSVKNIAYKNDVTYLDFNLLKNKSSLINDKQSFAGWHELSYEGAVPFSKTVCSIIKQIENGEDVSDMFYDSYNEAIKHFEYYEIYQSMLKEQS